MKLLNKCFSAHRYFYNKAVAEINTRYENRKKEFTESKTCIHCRNEKMENSFSCEKHQSTHIKWKLDINLASIRKSVMKNDEELKFGNKKEKWQIEIPYDTRQLAIKDAVSAYNSCVSNFKNGNIKKFKLKYVSRFKPTQIFWIDKDALKIKNSNLHLFVERLGNRKFINKSKLRVRNKSKNLIPEKIISDSKMLYDRGAWYIVTSIADKTEKVNQPYTSIALDPGVRTFQTGYSPDGCLYKMGEEKSKLICSLYDKIDRLRSVRDTTEEKRTKKNVKRRLAKLEFKVRGLINDLHNQTGSMLSKNYKTILLPNFKTSQMLDSSNDEPGKASLSSAAKRKMQGLAHYRFQQKLSHLSQKYGSRMILVSEAYTTKTCGFCGMIKENVGSAKIYNCDNCFYIVDRDFHGARNIWIRNFLEITKC